MVLNNKIPCDAPLFALFSLFNVDYENLESRFVLPPGPIPFFTVDLEVLLLRHENLFYFNQH